MTRLCTVETICGSAWGIVAHRRAEIESGGFGAFDRVLCEEMEAQFPTVHEAARGMGCHPRTAKVWLDRAEARFIHDGPRMRYYLPDVERAKLARSEFRRDRTRRPGGSAG